MIDTIINKINDIISMKTLCLVGIDGCGGAGKSTLAKTIISRYGSGQIIHMDDFYKLSNERRKLSVGENKPSAEYDISRLIRDVLEPINQVMIARYQKYDWIEDKLTEWHVIKPNGLIIIEGIYSISEHLYKYYDLTIFVECSRDLRLKRGLERDGENAFLLWKEWMEKEDQYLEEQKPQNRSDLIISGENKY